MSTELMISPLGAAIVEAMPNRKLIAKINRDFRRKSVCPTSSIYDAKGIGKFYASRGFIVHAVYLSVKANRKAR